MNNTIFHDFRQTGELPLSEQPPRVLNVDLSARLNIVNRAARKLRGYDVKLIGQDLRLQSAKGPLLVIAPPPQRLRAECRSFLNRDVGHGERLTQAHWHGVELAWTAESTEVAA